MTPHRTNRRGTFVLDRSVKGIGRIKRASGTTDPELFEAMNGMLVTLRKGGRVDLLKALRDGVMTPMEVWQRFRMSDLDSMPTVESMRDLAPALREWVAAETDVSAWHRQSRGAHVKALLAHAKAGDALTELPAILERYRRAAGGPVMFNRVRATCLAFVRDTLKRSNPIYGQVREIAPRKATVREPQPFTDAAALAVFAPQMGDYAPCVWAMALTGMGLGEYFGRWTLKADRVVIYGTKRKGRRREVPRFGDIAAPRGTREGFQRAWRKVADADRVPYDLRHTFGTWLERMGIPRTRRRLYLGHGAGDVTDLYEKHQVTAYLAEDGAVGRTWLGGLPPKAGLRLA